MPSANGIERRDPKSWPISLKVAVLSNICFFTMMGNMFSASITTGFPQLAHEFPNGATRLADQVTYTVLTLGLANLIWMPTALCVGKRPVFLLTLIILLAGSIWASVAQSFGSLLGARIFATVGAGSVESLGPSMIADVFHEKHFATAMAVYALALTVGSNLGPLAAGYLIDARGWRWAFHLCSILVSLNLASSLFFLPETSVNQGFMPEETATVSEKEVPNVDECARERATPCDVKVVSEVRATRLQHGSSYWRDLFRLKLEGVNYHGWGYWFYQFTLPLRFLLVPSVVFACAAYGITLGWVVIISTLAPTIFAPSPYNFDSSGVGLFGLAAFIGVLVAFPFAGPLTDSLSLYLGKRNSRRNSTAPRSSSRRDNDLERTPTPTHMPEHRMPALLVPFIVCPAGLLVFAYSYISPAAYEESLHGSSGINIPSPPWIGPAVGYGMSYSGIALVSSVVLSYVVDAYPETSGEALVLINCVRNVIAFGLSVKGTAWMEASGIRNMFITMAALQWAILSLSLPLYFTGPWFRSHSIKLG